MSPSSSPAALNAGARWSPEGTAMLAGLTGKHIARAGRLGSGPALGPQRAGSAEESLG